MRNTDAQKPTTAGAGRKGSFAKSRAGKLRRKARRDAIARKRFILDRLAN